MTTLVLSCFQAIGKESLAHSSFSLNILLCRDRRQNDFIILHREQFEEEVLGSLLRSSGWAEPAYAPLQYRHNRLLKGA